MWDNDYSKVRAGKDEGMGSAIPKQYEQKTDNRKEKRL